MTPKDRILFVLKEKGIKSASEITDSTDKMYHNIYKQLFSDNVKNISSDMIAYILEKFPDISADYVIRGEGSWERKTSIVTTHRQDIHVDGGQAAITQTGEAKLESPSTNKEPSPDIAQMIRDNDLGGLVAIIMQQKDEIIRLKEQRIRDLETSVRIADANLFPPVK